MFQPDIKIKHNWCLKSASYHTIVASYSASFVDKLLPDVKFSIFCCVSDHSKCTLILSRYPCDLANATVQILLTHYEKKDKTYNYSWVNNYTFQREFYVPDPQCMRGCKRDSDYFLSYTFECCIMFPGFIEPKRSINLYGYLKNFLTVPDFSDTMIVIDEKEIPVHKIILAAYSPVFLAMFKAGMTESTNKRIVVTDIEVDIMEKVVEFMYTGTINPVPEYDVLLSILKVADKYEMKDLKDLCEEKLSKEITVENVFEILEKNSLYGGPLLTKNVLYFMVKNKSSIIELEDFEDFYRKKPELLADFFIHSIAADKGNF